MNDHRESRRVWLIRHAKAAEAESDQRDFDRPLTEKGQSQCDPLREWLSDRVGEREVKALISPAVRTQQTADLVLADWFEGPRVPAERIWNASAGKLTELLEENAGHLALVGHNPGLEQLQSMLTGQVVPLPTGGAFELAFDDEGRCLLEARFQPSSEST